MKLIFKKTYDGESMVDLGRDVHEAFETDFNSNMIGIAQDEDGFLEGSFTVTIIWNAE